MSEQVRALLRAKRVCELTGASRSTLYEWQAQGLFVRPIALSARSVAWPSDEVAEWVNAKVRGASADDLRRLVSRLEAARKNDLPVAA